MRKYLDDTDMSELEREFELEMDDGNKPSSERELEKEFEALLEYEEPEEEFEYGEDEELAERLYELSLREFESEFEVDEALNEILDDMEREYFFGKVGKLFKKVKKGVRSLSRSPIGGLISKVAKSSIPGFQAIQGVTQLARGDLNGLLRSLMKSGLGAAFPGAGLAGQFLPGALKALGFEVSEDPEDNREAWNNMVDVSREAFNYLAENITEGVDDPVEASRLAHEAFVAAMQKVGNNHRSGMPSYRRSPLLGQVRRGGRVVHVRPGERITVVVDRS